MQKRKVIFYLFLIVLINISFVLSEESISVSYEKNVIIGREFNLNLKLFNFSGDTYDVKIEILDGTHNIAKRYFDSSWKSTNYWMNGAINTSKSDSIDIKLNITDEFTGENNFTIKLRSGDESFEFGGYYLNISKIKIQNENNQTQNNNSNHTINTQNNSTQNNSNNVSNNTNNNNNNNNNNNSNENDEDDEIELKLSFDDEEIINGEEFMITIEATNLLNKDYDVKVYIYDDDEKIISDIYNEDNEWVTSNWYYNNFFSGPGDKEDEIKLRIKESYRDFYGDANIGLRIREHGKSAYEELKTDIEVIKSNDDYDEEDEEVTTTKKSTKTSSKSVTKTNETKTPTNSVKTITANVISMKKPESIKTTGINLYESKNQSIKKYMIILFLMIFVTLVTILIFKGFNYKDE